MSGYRELPVPASLAPFAECAWHVPPVARSSSRPARSRQSVLPDGCVDLLFSCGDAGDAANPAPRLVFVGAMTRAVDVDVDPVRTLAAIRFRPGGCAALFGPVHDWTDGVVEAEAVWGDRARRLVDALVERPSSRHAAMLAAALAERPAVVDARVARMLAGLRTGAAVGAVAADVGLSRQSVRRVVREATGLTPKRFQRIARFRRASAAIESGEPIARVAVACGYVDQAHLTNEFAELARRSPAAWARGFHSSKTAPAAARTIEAR